MIVSVLSRSQDMIVRVVNGLSTQFGDTDFISEIFPFDFTSYYEGEMGKGLIRRFLSLDETLLPDRLPDIKLYTNRLEESLLDGHGNRKVNVDPGYISLSHLILATGKGYAHRPYLRNGIFADLTLIYKEKTFHALDWTYPDYRSKEIIRLMNSIRKKLVFQLKG